MAYVPDLVHIWILHELCMCSAFEVGATSNCTLYYCNLLDNFLYINFEDWKRFVTEKIFITAITMLQWQAN